MDRKMTFFSLGSFSCEVIELESFAYLILHKYCARLNRKVTLIFWGDFFIRYIFFFYESKQLLILKADMYWYKMRVLSLPKTETKVGRNIDYWLCWILFTNNNLFPFWYLKKNWGIQNTAVNGPEKIKENIIITKSFEVQKFDYFRFL